jgi:hypothetical protein
MGAVLIYFAYRRGILGDSEWERFERAICRGKSRDRDDHVFPIIPEGTVKVTNSTTGKWE